jgi:hypothetical protein
LLISVPDTHCTKEANHVSVADDITYPHAANAIAALEGTTWRADNSLRAVVDHHIDAVNSLYSYDRNQAVLPSRRDLK